MGTRAWREALKRVGIEDFRWHDLRHTWASWLAQRGTPSKVLQEMGAWESEGMVRRYAHLAPANFAEHAERIAGLIGGTDLAHATKEKGPSRSYALEELVGRAGFKPATDGLKADGLTLNRLLIGPPSLAKTWRNAPNSHVFPTVRC